MVTSSSRTRMKKVNFRQKLTIAKGSHLLETSTPLVAGDAEFDGQENHDSNLGVDSGEISEHHLQAALSSTQLASDSSDQKKASYHIPTPSANGVLSAQEAAELYPPGVYQDPVSYVRFSDTVEDCIRGPSYNLDEDDADWLEEQNTKAKEEGAVALRNYRPPSTKKGKEKAKEDPMTVLVRQNPNLHIITEDEFEMVMTIFERVSKELVPYAHLDKSNLPTFEDLQSSFEADSPLSKLALPELPDLPQDQQATSSSSTLNSSSSGSSTEWSVSNPYRNLHILKPIASRVYPWWKQRREEREGKGVEPTLNFDESNDNDPYVCFRRREVKMMRKTRKTDALHIEKLIRLQSELEQASVVLSAFAQRERGSRAALQRNRSRWDALRDGCDPKRVWEIVATVRGLDEEEEERREEQAAHKRRRREQEAGGKSGRRRAEEEAAAGGEKAGLGSAILERVHAVQAYIEKECQLKASFDIGWEEATDVAFQPIPAPAALRSFRPISSDMPDSQYQSQFQQQQSISAPRAGRPPSFRRRVGRGGRIFLDRKLPTPSPVPSSLNDWARHDQILEQDSIREQEHQSSQGPFSFSNSPSSRLQEMAAPPTGPFAFLPTVRPTLLGSPSQPPEPSKSGPFAGPFSQSQHSDASSTSSESSARSGTSLGGTSVSTLPTEADDVDIMAIDSFDKLEDQGHDRDEEEDEEMQIDPQEEMERWSRLQERWRYDDEAGRWAGLGLCGLGGMEDDEEAVLDDFDQRFLKYRIGLLEEIDLMKLGTDSTHLAQARAAAETPTPQPIGIVTAGGMMNMGQVYGHRNSHGGNPSAAIQAQQAAAIAAAQAMARQSGSNNPLTTLQQQQQMHSQQLLLQQQQAAQQRAAQQSSPAPSRRGAQGSQPHPLSQSHSFSSSPNTNQIQQQQAALQQLRQAAAAAGSNQQQLPQGFPNGFPNGNGAGSPPLQSHLVGGQGSSSPSPVPMQQNGNRNQQQQQQRGGGGMNGMNFNGLTAEQLQAVLNGAAANGASNNPNLQAQIAAMKAAVASNPNLQLKLPPNRAMQIAQQMSNLGMNAGNNGMNGNNNGTNGRQHSNSPGYAA